MILVVDVNVILSALIRDSTTRKLLAAADHTFFFPERAVQKIHKYEPLIRQKTRLSAAELRRLEERLLRLVQMVPDEDIEPSWEEAKAVMEDVDTEDVLFIAAALSREEAAVWSDDKHFGKQDRIDWYTTSDLVALDEEMNS